MGRYRLILVCLVDYLWNELGSSVGQSRVKDGNFRVRYCVCRSIFEEEGQEGKDGANEEGENESIYYEENDEPTAHCDRLSRMQFCGGD